MFKNGIKDLGHDLHVPAPGRVQYYRAEVLPFVPQEIKTQIRFPKAYAQSEQNLRYLDKVRDQTQAFLSQRVSHNFFTGEATIPLSLTLDEAEVLFSANDEVKQLAQSGALKTLHDKCGSLKEASESQYLNTRDRIENIIEATHSKEDEIYESLIEEYELTGVRKHGYGESIFDIVGLTRGLATIENLSILEGNIENGGDHGLQKCHDQLLALLKVKVSALESLVALQEGYCKSVEKDDAAAENDLKNLTHKFKTFKECLDRHTA